MKFHKQQQHQKKANMPISLFQMQKAQFIFILDFRLEHLDLIVVSISSNSSKYVLNSSHQMKAWCSSFPNKGQKLCSCHLIFLCSLLRGSESGGGRRCMPQS